MSNLDEFLEDPYMDEFGGVGDFTTIAKVMVQPAFQGWAFGTPKLFPYDGSKKAGSQAKENCAEYCQGENSFPQQGLLTTVYGEDVPTHPDGKMNDWYDFVPVFHSQEKYTGKVDVTGDYPYDLVLAGMKANPSVFCQTQWCELSRPVDNVREPKRDKDNTKYAHRVYVVEKVFKSREAAYAASNVDIDSAQANIIGALAGDFNNSGGLSEFAQKEWSLEALKEQRQTIQNMIGEALKGDNTPDGIPLDKEAAAKFVCAEIGILPADLDLLLDEAPF